MPAHLIVRPAVNAPDDLAARLAQLEAELARLRERYDQLMSAFKFDEARALTGAIEATEREHATLAAGLPPAAGEARPYTVARPRRRRAR